LEGIGEAGMISSSTGIDVNFRKSLSDISQMMILNLILFAAWEKLNPVLVTFCG